jgi:hypothetical protein
MPTESPKSATDLSVIAAPVDTATTDAVANVPPKAKDFEHRITGNGSKADRMRLLSPQASLFNLPATAAADAMFKHICAVADAHLDWVVRWAVVRSFIHLRESCGENEQQAQLRRREWANAILKLVRLSCASVDPNVRMGDRSDLRVYLKVKAVPLPMVEPENGCRVGACDIISGVMFRRSLPHKGMRHDIVRPRIMLLNGMCYIQISRVVFCCMSLFLVSIRTADSISFEGRLNAKLLSLETLGEQERQYLEILVNKVLALRPDVLFVTGTVSSAALEMLLGGSASVVPGVKLSLLHRLSRFTGARILPSVNLLDKIEESDVIGVAAGRFFVKSLQVRSPDDRGKLLSWNIHCLFFLISRFRLLG